MSDMKLLTDKQCINRLNKAYDNWVLGNDYDPSNIEFYVDVSDDKTYQWVMRVPEENNRKFTMTCDRFTGKIEIDDYRLCPQCSQEKLAAEFRWACDHYGIEYKKVCSDECERDAVSEIRNYVDGEDGTSVEPDYDLDKYWD